MPRKTKTPKVFGYVRVSTERQDYERQNLEIFECANKHNWKVADIISVKIGSQKSEELRAIDQLRDLAKQDKMNVLIFSELSRLGRSVGQIARLVQEFVEDYGIKLIFVKEGLIVKQGKKDITTKVTLTMFSLLAEIERDLISERTKSALAARKKAGVKLGRPALKSKLDRKENQIKEMLGLCIKQKAIAKKVGCTEATLCNWLKRKRKVWAT